jgi:hypothetical protein
MQEYRDFISILVTFGIFCAREYYQFRKDKANKTDEKIEKLESSQERTEQKIDHLIEIMEKQDREYDRRLSMVERRL